MKNYLVPTFTLVMFWFLPATLYAPNDGPILPVEIQIKKLGTVAAPLDGLVVKVGDTLEFKLTDTLSESFPVPRENIKWYQKQMKWDGTYTGWQDIGAHARGVKFEHTCGGGGIFQVKAELTVGLQVIPVIFDRDKDELRTVNGPMGPGRKGQPDAVGVVDTQIQIDVRNEAQLYLGSTAYPNEGYIPASYGFSEYVSNTLKCNIFVAHRACAVGATVPAINGYLRSYLPIANQWGGIEDCYPANPFPNDHIPTTNIFRWGLLARSTNPQPGYIVADSHPGDAGHCGIIDYDGGGIGAGTSGTVNKNWDFYGDAQSGEPLEEHSRLRAFTP